MNTATRRQVPERPQPLTTADVLRFMAAAFITGVSLTVAFFPRIEPLISR